MFFSSFSTCFTCVVSCTGFAQFAFLTTLSLASNRVWYVFYCLFEVSILSCVVENIWEFASTGGGAFFDKFIPRRKSSHFSSQLSYACREGSPTSEHPWCKGFKISIGIYYIHKYFLENYTRWTPETRHSHKTRTGDGRWNVFELLSDTCLHTGLYDVNCFLL